VSYSITIKDMLEAGVHFGHQTRRWNPKMKPFIFAEKNGIYILDLQQTQRLAAMAYEKVRQVAGTGAPILFVGPKKQAQDTIREEALRCGQFYVVERWLGGLLTNFQTVRKSLDKLTDIEKMNTDGRIEQFNKKERMQLEKTRDRLERMLGGIRGMEKTPGLIFVVDTAQSEIAIKEANKLGVPVVAMVDTNCDPDPVNFPIPGNDDAIRSIRLFSHMIADAVIEGAAFFKAREREEKAVVEKASAEKEAEERTPRRAAAPASRQELAPRVAARLKVGELHDDSTLDLDS